MMGAIEYAVKWCEGGVNDLQVGREEIKLLQ
jgi:hypothetical protein